MRTRVEETRTSRLAIAALILGSGAIPLSLASLIISFRWSSGLFYGIISLVLISAIMAIIFGAIGMSQTNKDPTLKGRGMAIAGLVIGITVVVWWIMSVGGFILLALLLGD